MPRGEIKTRSAGSASCQDRYHNAPGGARSKRRSSAEIAVCWIPECSGGSKIETARTFPQIGARYQIAPGGARSKLRSPRWSWRCARMRPWRPIKTNPRSLSASKLDRDTRMLRGERDQNDVIGVVDRPASDTRMLRGERDQNDDSYRNGTHPLIPELLRGERDQNPNVLPASLKPPIPDCSGGSEIITKLKNKN